MACASDINRLNKKWHIVGALDFERYRLLLPRRSSHTMSPPEVLLPFLKEAGFGDAIQLKDFIFDNTLISAFVERWRPETHTFHLSWGECTITLQDVAYHLGLCTDGEPVVECMRDFQTWHQCSTWQWVEDLLGARPPMQSQGRKEGFAIKLAWLRERVQNIPAGAGDDTLRQYARCYILMLIGGYLMTDKSNNLVHIRWLPLLADFDRCRQMLVGLGQQSRDHHEGRLLRWRHRLDTVCFDQFRWTPYDRPELQALCPDWLRSGHEIHTWRAVVPLVCFNFVEFHHVDRVKRQFGSDQQIPEDPVNVDKYLSTTARGDDVWWPEVLREWYDRWRARHQPCHMITITPEPNRLTQEYILIGGLNDVAFDSCLLMTS
ncbi:hypothetical protein Ahy_A04g021510 [Arachis hypogaea]|uniref:Aminotransferase-like plant mobile domain-containing protein n=1 Tax=Arachis hypogaea TaxID=3818 RepID=A0A445DKN5_ARAHY|nr:hypothetical protein Ahy_A04g021510 [Arachis hypogaea]